MSTEPARVPGGAERPVERTDPMLPVVVDGMPPPDGLPPLAAPRVPTLDDASLAEMIAELDGVDPVPGPRSAEDEPAFRPGPVAAHDAYPLPAEPSVRYQPPRPDPIAVDRYVRRDSRPSPPPAEALSLTGLSRHARGKLGSRLFAVLFAAIFVLIVVQAVISLISAA